MTKNERKSPNQEPRRRNAERTSREILDAAISEFTEFGLDGARVDRIAEKAGANKRMMYHYYGNKDQLFLAALEDAYARIRAAEQELDLMHLPPREAIRRLTEFTWDYYLAHPEFLSLLGTENLHNASHIAMSEKIQSMHSPFVSMLRKILERGIEAGDFRGDVDPVQLYISIAGLGYFYLTNRYTLSAVFDKNLMTKPALKARREHIDAVIQGFLRPIL